LASIHGTVSTILAVHTSAPCSPCMNWLSVQFCDSMPNWIHSFSDHFSNGVPLMSIEASGPMPVAPLAMALARTTCSWSTSVSHGRSVSPFHCDVLAFS
jgi:hypothetical protein